MRASVRQYTEHTTTNQGSQFEGNPWGDCHLIRLTGCALSAPDRLVIYIACTVSTVTTMTAVSSDDHDNYELRHPRLSAVLQSTTDRPAVKHTALLTSFQNYILAWRRGGGKNYT